MAHKLIDAPDWQLMLAGRDVPDSTPRDGHRMKLLPQEIVSFDSVLPMGKIDAAKMAVTMCISTPNIDQSRDVVIGKGIDTKIHKANPLVLFMHKPTLPIAKSFHPSAGYTVDVGDKQTTATAYFFQNSTESEQVFRLIEMGALPGASVGIRPKVGKVKQLADEDGVPYCVIEECSLIEWSTVFFPDNPDALVVAIQKGLGGRSLVSSLKDTLLPLLPPRRTWSNGATLPSTKLHLRTIPMATNYARRHKQMPMGRNGSPNGNGRPNGGTNGMPEPGADGMQQQDTRPTGAQFGSALYEMAVAMTEFISENSQLLEPETANAFNGTYRHISGLMQDVADAYETRYPGLPPLAAVDPLAGPRMNGDDALDDMGDGAMGNGEGLDGDLVDDGAPLDDGAAMDDGEDEFAAADTDNDGDIDDDDDDEAPPKKGKKPFGKSAMWYRTKARACVREWWAKREKKLSKGERGCAGDAAEFLDEAAKHSGSWSRTQRSASAYHSKSLRRLCKSMNDDVIAVEERKLASAALPADDRAMTKLLDLMRERGEIIAKLSEPTESA